MNRYLDKFLSFLEIERNYSNHTILNYKIDLDEFAELIYYTTPNQVNIGADSKRNNLPEPSKEKVLALIAELEKFTVVKQKSNLARLLK